MTPLRWYLAGNRNNNSGFQNLTQTAQSAATLLSGWVVGTGATLNSEFSALSGDRAATTFVGSTVPDGVLDDTIFDALQTDGPLNGTFAAGNWTFQFAVVSTVQAGAADGQIVFRLIKAGEYGANPTLITPTQQTASVMTNVGATDINGTLTFNPGAITFNNEWLFVQVAWKRTGAGGMTTTNIKLRTGVSATVGTTILSADFTPVAPVDQAITTTSLVLTAVLNVPTVAFPAAQAITGATIFNAYGRQIIADGATGYWRFQNASLIDSIGYAHGSIYTPGAVDMTTGVYDQALLFTASHAARVEFPHTPALDLTGQGTLECWINMPANTTDLCFFAKGKYGQAWGYGMAIYSNGHLLWRRNMGDYVADSIVLPRDRWVHLVMTATETGSVLKIYIDGVLYTGTFTLLGGAGNFFLSTTEPMGVGYARGTSPIGTEYLDGALDEIAVYPTVLTQAQIVVHAAGPGLFPPTVFLPGANQAVTGNTIPSGAVVRVASVAPGPVTVTGTSVASGLSVNVPAIAPGPVAVTAATVTTGSLVRVPSVTVGLVTVLGVSVSSGIVLNVPTVTSGAVSVTTGTIASGSGITVPSVTSVSLVIAATIPTSLSANGPSVTTGPVTVTGATQVTTAVVNAPAIIPASGLVIGGTVTSGSVVRAPLIYLAFTKTILSYPGLLYPGLYSVAVLAPTWINGETCSSTVQVNAPNVVLDVAVVGGSTVGSTASMFAPTLAVGPATIEGATRLSTTQFYPPNLTVGPVTVVGATISSATQTYAISLTVGAVSITMVTRPSTAQVFVPIVSIGTPTLPSTVLLFPPVLISLNVTTATRPTTSVVNVPTLTAQVTTATRPTTVQLNAPTILPQPVTVGGVTVLSTSQMFPPSLFVGPVSVIGATIVSGSLVRVPSVVPGPVTVTGATLTSSQQVFSPSVAVGAVTISGTTIVSTTQVFRPIVSIGLPTIASTVLLAPPMVTTVTFVTTGNRPATSQVFAPSVLAVTSVSGTTRASTATLNAPTLAYVVVTAQQSSGSTVFAPSVLSIAFVSGATIGSTAILRVPSIAVGPVAVTTPALVSTVQLFPPTLTAIAAGSLGGATIPKASVVNPPSVALGLFIVNGATIASTSTRNAPTVAYVVNGVTLVSTLVLRPPIVTTLTFVNGATITNVVGMTPPSVTTVTFVGGATCSSTLQITAPMITPGPVSVGGSTIGSGSQVFPPFIGVGVTVVGGATIIAGIQTYPPFVTTLTFVGGVTQPSTLQIFAPAIAPGPVTEGGATIGSGSQCHPPSVGTGLTIYLPTILPAVVEVYLLLEDGGYVLQEDGIGRITLETAVHETPVFPPTVIQGAGIPTVGGVTCPSTAVLYPPTVGREIFFTPSTCVVSQVGVRYLVTGGPIDCMMVATGQVGVRVVHTSERTLTRAAATAQVLVQCRVSGSVYGSIDCMMVTQVTARVIQTSKSALTCTAASAQVLVHYRVTSANVCACCGRGDAPMNSRVILKRGNDQVVTLSGLRATQTGDFLNAATVFATLYDSKGKIVPAFVKVPMTYVSGSDGDYEWVIESDTMMLPKSVEYSLEIKAEQQGLNYRTVRMVSVIDGDS